MVSWHFFRAKNRGVDPKLVANRDSFQRFVEELFANSFWQEDLPDVVDSSWRLLRQECLVSDIRNGLSQLGLAVRDVPSYKSGSFPRGEAGYREFYSKSTRQLVEARYRKWLSAFNYEF